MGLGWRLRLYKVTAGLGHGPSAATIELVLEGPEWIGPFGSPAADNEREASVRAHLAEQLTRRFPGESVVLVSAIPAAKRQRPSWDR